MSLTEARFHDLVDSTLENLEEVFDESGLDLDQENSSGMLTVKFEGGSQLIFSRQEPLLQLWLATSKPSGAYHFEYKESSSEDEDGSYWFCVKSEEKLNEILARFTLEQSGADLDFDEI
ncbi:iron donor protein CyaY [Pseudomonas gingeri]|uniref:iron donor protein CyaY n=1 Tax=Pseudomonas gingeri TaxID=117681 RepID=UPI0015A318E2|nr:iron donor protein CyaY [Pseudomonas gingeri]NWA04287.1 iron donor protein CyaY [Pseudomonas gingeri]NWA15138.1 iron donor protein CyaY [Pseudomonas gingeri]NWA54579.1 iron donor protein CyaY [Pseudomonas gingeri]NWA98336.1 iron donor protein CyaY [Pseudomonas gingeri]NWB04150.1 iron donor protein CyaY [Pseudomonas gingeri]